jgi:hypothetical protein
MTTFERAVVFRVARGYFFLMAIVAVLLFLGGVAFGARSLAKEDIPAPAPPPPVPARAPLTLAEVEDQLRRDAAASAQAAGGIELTPQPGESTRVPAPEEDALKKAVDRLKTLFPDPPYSWQNELETVCSVPSAFGCLQSGTRIKRYGVAGTISKALEGMNRSEAIEFLGILFEVLKLAPVDRRLALVLPTISAEKQARDDYARLVAKHRHDTEEQQTKYQLEVDLDRAKHAEWRQLGMYGLGAGFSLLIVVSLFLAFLSMERHTRVLESLVSKLGPD